jgi:hypothetical protein
MFVIVLHLFVQSSDRPTILETEIRSAPILCYKSGPNVKVQH